MIITCSDSLILITIMLEVKKCWITKIIDMKLPCQWPFWGLWWALPTEVHRMALSQKNAMVIIITFYLFKKKKKLWWLEDPLWNIQINNEPCNENFFDLTCCTKVMVRNSRKYITEVIFPQPNLSVNFLDNNSTVSLTERKEANSLAIYIFFHMDSIKEEKEISNSKNRGIDPLSHTNTNP